MHPVIRHFLLVGLLCAAGRVTQAAEPAKNPDPWEGFNRQIFGFNEFLDGHFLKPVAKGYQAVTPQFVDTGVSNFFGNIGEVPIFVNHVIQFRLGKAGAGAGRFALNSTLGLFGLFDVASKMGIEKHETDLGETFGRWGAGPGPYLMLPLLGPSTVRDGVGTAGGIVLDPIAHLDSNATRWPLRTLGVVDGRADLLSVEELITGDRYAFLRDLYLQRRQYQITGALPEEDFLDDEDL